jgi:hypothetical protein
MTELLPRCAMCQDWRHTKNEEAVTIVNGTAVCSFHAKEAMRVPRRAPIPDAKLSEATYKVLCDARDYIVSRAHTGVEGYSIADRILQVLKAHASPDPRDADRTYELAKEMECCRHALCPMSRDALDKALAAIPPAPTQEP